MTKGSLYKMRCHRKCRALLVTLFAFSVGNNFALIAQSRVAKERRAVIYKSPSLTAIAVTAVRNLQNESWLEDLEIEAKNVSAKPVYSVQILIVLATVSAELDGVPRRLTIPLEYGRVELIRDGQFATSDDIPLKAGESRVFKIPEMNRKAVERRLASGAVQPQELNKIHIRVESVSFGDGTGFRSAMPFP